MTRYRVTVTVAIWIVLVGALHASDSQPDALVLAGIVGVVAAAGFAAVDLLRATAGVAWVSAPQPPLRKGDDEAVVHLARQIRAAHRSPSVPLHDALVDLVDQRLLDRHGIDRAEQPATGSALLTPGLIRLMAQHSIRLSDADNLNTLLDEIEAT